MNKILSYQMRVDRNTGQVYRGSLVEIENSLKTKQDYVGGLIQVLTIEDIDIICNDEGKLMGLLPNRALLDESGEIIDIFVGNILAVRHNEEGEFTSILSDDIRTINKYLKPLFRVGTKLMVIPKEDWLEEYKEKKDESSN